jgi:hypothetical protein
MSRVLHSKPRATTPKATGTHGKSLDTLVNKHSAEWLQARSELVAILVREGVLDTRNDIAGFSRGDEWISIYDLLEEYNGNN